MVDSTEMDTVDRSCSDSPTINALVTLSAPASLSSSMGELPVNGGRGNLVLCMDYEQYQRKTQPLNARYPSIEIFPNYTHTHNTSASTALAESFLATQQESLKCNSLFQGLAPLKRWVSSNVQRVLTGTPMERRMPPDAVAVTISSEGCGVRSYLEQVCNELRIDLFVIARHFFHAEMFKELLDEARARQRAMILFDRADWFETQRYGCTGVAFISCMEALIRQQRAAQMITSATEYAFSNTMTATTLGELVPGLWLVVSCNTPDVVQDLLRHAPGSLFHLHQASKEVAYTTARSCIRQRLQRFEFAIARIDEALSQTEYAATLQGIATLLQAYEPGRVVAIVQRALKKQFDLCCDNARAQGFTFSPILEAMLPTQQAVQLATNEILGQAASSTTQAASLARQINVPGMG